MCKCRSALAFTTIRHRQNYYHCLGRSQLWLTWPLRVGQRGNKYYKKVMRKYETRTTVGMVNKYKNLNMFLLIIVHTKAQQRSSYCYNIELQQMSCTPSSNLKWIHTSWMSGWINVYYVHSHMLIHFLTQCVHWYTQHYHNSSMPPTHSWPQVFLSISCLFFSRKLILNMHFDKGKVAEWSPQTTGFLWKTETHNECNDTSTRVSHTFHYGINIHRVVGTHALYVV